MAKTADEYKEELLYRLNGDAFLAEKDVQFMTTQELPYVETDKQRTTLLKKIEVATELGAYLRTLEQAVTEIDVV